MTPARGGHGGHGGRRGPGGPSRRAVLRAALVAAGLGAAGTVGTAAGCRLRPAAAEPAAEGPGDAGGPFSWRRAEGQAVRVLMPDNVHSRAVLADLRAFSALTGIRVEPVVVAEGTYGDAVTVALIEEEVSLDCFLTGVPMIWQYGPPGWLEDLRPWLADASLTSPGYEVEDVYPHLLAANRWDFTETTGVGSGGQWALPLSWEATVVTYDAVALARLGLRPPETLGELEEVAAAAQAGGLAAGVPGAYGLAVRGQRSWDSLDAAFLTQFTREGGRDLVPVDGLLEPRVSAPESVEFHRRWVELVRRAGPPDWRSYDRQACARDLAALRTPLAYDTTATTLPLDAAGATAASGRLAWHPGPAGPDGDLSSNLWTWSVAMTSASRRKTAAWLFLQWVTGHEHLLRAAVEFGAVDPVRRSVVEHAMHRRAMSVHRDYTATVDAVRDHTRVVSTPRLRFFDSAVDWVDALHDMYGGADAQARLEVLAEDLGA